MNNFSVGNLFWGMQFTPIVILSVAKYQNKINLRIAQQIKSFCYFLLLQKVESPLPRHCEIRQRRIEAKQAKRSFFSNQKNQHNGAK